MYIWLNLIVLIAASNEMSCRFSVLLKIKYGYRYPVCVCRNFFGIFSGLLIELMLKLSVGWICWSGSLLSSDPDPFVHFDPNQFDTDRDIKSYLITKFVFKILNFFLRGGFFRDEFASSPSKAEDDQEIICNCGLKNKTVSITYYSLNVFSIMSNCSILFVAEPKFSDTFFWVRQFM